MKRLHKVLLMTMLLATGNRLYAQVTVSAGPELGFTLTGLYSDEYSSSDPEIFAGVNGHIGGTVHVQFWHFLAIRPSIFFKAGIHKNADYEDSKIALNRIAVPIPVMFSYQFRNNSLLFFGAGPNFMYALSGKIKSGSISNDISFGKAANEWKPLDVGLHIKGGSQFKNGLALNTFFNAGFTNLLNQDFKMRSMDAFGLSLGYMFGGRGKD